MKPLHALLPLLLITLAACTTVGPDYEAPEPVSDALWIDPPDEADLEFTQDFLWWKSFEDPLLESLLERAMAANLSIQAAEARVERARALRRASSSDARPQLSAAAGHTRQRSSPATSRSSDSSTSARSTYDIGLNASWEIDFFGGTRRSAEAAQARLESSVDERRAVQLAVLAEVSRNYYTVRGAQKGRAITETNIELQERTLELVETLFRLGEASEFDATRARAQLQLTQSRMPAIDAIIREGMYRLSVLLGSPPGTLLEEMSEPTSLPALPDRLPLGQASDILRRRPDVRAAERTLAASTADIGIATADLFPRFTLLGSVGRSGESLDDLRSSVSDRYLWSQFIQWPILQGGLIRSQIQIEKAEALEAAALYEQTVLEALADAESALISYLRQRDTQSILRQALASQQRSVELARKLFNAGEENFLSVLDAERELISVENDLVISETDTVLRLITLYTALGGGWQDGEK